MLNHDSVVEFACHFDSSRKCRVSILDSYVFLSSFPIIFEYFVPLNVLVIDIIHEYPLFLCASLSSFLQLSLLLDVIQSLIELTFLS